MTITEFSKLSGISKSTIYRRLKSKHISFESLRGEDENTLSQEGLSILSSLFSFDVQRIMERPENVSCDNDDTPRETDDTREKAMLEELTALKIENAELKAAAAAKEQIIAQLQDRLSDLQGQLLYMQQLQAATLQRIPERVTIWQRLTGKAPKEKK